MYILPECIPCPGHSIDGIKILGKGVAEPTFWMRVGLQQVLLSLHRIYCSKARHARMRAMYTAMNIASSVAFNATMRFA